MRPHVDKPKPPPEFPGAGYAPIDVIGKRMIDEFPQGGIDLGFEFAGRRKGEWRCGCRIAPGQ